MSSARRRVRVRWFGQCICNIANVQPTQLDQQWTNLIRKTSPINSSEPKAFSFCLRLTHIHLDTQKFLLYCELFLQYSTVQYSTVQLAKLMKIIQVEAVVRKCNAGSCPALQINGTGTVPISYKYVLTQYSMDSLRRWIRTLQYIARESASSVWRGAGIARSEREASSGRRRTDRSGWGPAVAARVKASEQLPHTQYILYTRAVCTIRLALMYVQYSKSMSADRLIGAEPLTAQLIVKHDPKAIS